MQDTRSRSRKVWRFMKSRNDNAIDAVEGVFHLKVEEAVERFKKGKASICVVGLGRIGLPTAAMFANSGLNVIGADINPAVVFTLNKGKCRFVDEPGLDKMIERSVQKGNLKATTDVPKAVSQSSLIIICVPTPVDQAKSPDYSAIINTSHTIGKVLRRGSIVVVES